LRVLIADDEPIARAILREQVDSIAGLELAGEASTGPEAISRILDLRPDVVLLDLQMPELDGLAVVRSLNGERSPLIIFVTAYENHALAAFEVGAIDYLLKPVRRERLEKAIEKARRQLKPSAKPDTLRKIVGRRGSDMYLLDPSEIVAFQAEGEHCRHSAAVSERSFPEIAGRQTGPETFPPHSSQHDYQHRSHPQNFTAVEQTVAVEDVE